jgi:hypothetical protein
MVLWSDFSKLSHIPKQQDVDASEWTEHVLENDGGDLYNRVTHSSFRDTIDMA